MTESQEQKTPKTEAVCRGISGRRANSNSGEWWSRLAESTGVHRWSGLWMYRDEQLGSGNAGEHSLGWWVQCWELVRRTRFLGKRIMSTCVLWIWSTLFIIIRVTLTLFKMLTSCSLWFFSLIIILSKYYKTAGMWRHTPSIPVLREAQHQEQVLYKLQNVGD